MNSTTMFAALGVGLMVVAGTVGCGSPPAPASPDPASTSAAAGDKDTDGDGVPDSKDKCLDRKEDGLGTAPKDGCPNAAAAPAPAPKP